MNSKTKKTARFNRPFYDLRKQREWTQEQMGEAVGYNGHTVGRIESGTSEGKLDLWQRVKEEFEIPAEDMWDLMTGNEKGKKATEDERITEEI